jgi:hypothetical protein
MTILDHERLQARRTEISECILSLQRGLIAERNKIALFQMHMGGGLYDDDAMVTQIGVCHENIDRIEQTLSAEQAKLKRTDRDLKVSHDLLAAHGTATCLMGVQPHSWVVTDRHLSGRHAKRHCVRCGTVESVGVS